MQFLLLLYLFYKVFRKDRILTIPPYSIDAALIFQFSKDEQDYSV